MKTNISLGLFLVLFSSSTFAAGVENTVAPKICVDEARIHVSKLLDPKYALASFPNGKEFTYGALALKLNEERYAYKLKNEFGPREKLASLSKSNPDSARALRSEFNKTRAQWSSAALAVNFETACPNLMYQLPLGKSPDQNSSIFVVETAEKADLISNRNSAMSSGEVPYQGHHEWRPESPSILVRKDAWSGSSASPARPAPAPVN